jgi:hypothetical protein
MAGMVIAAEFVSRFNWGSKARKAKPPPMNLNVNRVKNGLIQSRISGLERYLSMIARLSVILFAVSTAFSQTIVRPPTYSATAGDLRCFVSVATGKRWIDSGDQLTFYFHSSSNQSLAVLIPQDGYFFSAQLLDARSNSIALTTLGKDLTRNFSKVTRFAPDLIKRHRRLKESYESVHAKPESEGSTGNYFYSAEELFRVKNPGEYILRLRFQVFTTPWDSTNVPALVRFPVIEIPISKDEN